jgi:hypothetical protein
MLWYHAWHRGLNKEEQCYHENRHHKEILIKSIQVLDYAGRVMIMMLACNVQQ